MSLLRPLPHFSLFTEMLQLPLPLLRLGLAILIPAVLARAVLPRLLSLLVARSAVRIQGMSISRVDETGCG